ncbi:MAG: ClpX C4-type zinc finger protein, partial [Planctomycetota bacterium]
MPNQPNREPLASSDADPSLEASALVAASGNGKGGGDDSDTDGTTDGGSGGGPGGGSGSGGGGGFRGRRVTTCSFCGKTSREVGPMVEGPS